MNSSIRKHISQMTDGEKYFLFSKALEIKDWQLSTHILERMHERGMFSMEDILDVLRFGELVEYHLRNNNNRILVRGSRSYYKYVPCIVFDIRTEKVITMYWNHEDDHHRTIDMSRYDEELDVVSLYLYHEHHSKNSQDYPCFFNKQGL